MNLYYIVTYRRDENDDPITGTLKGVSGFQNGVYGPVGMPEAKRVQSLMGGEIVEVEPNQDFVRKMVNKACKKAGLPVPYKTEDFDEDVDGSNPEIFEVEDETEEDAPSEEDTVEEDSDEDTSEEDAPEEDAPEVDTSDEVPEEEVVNEVIDALHDALDEEKLDGAFDGGPPKSTNLGAIDAASVVRRLESEAALDFFLGDDEKRKTVLDPAGRADE